MTFEADSNQDFVDEPLFYDSFTFSFLYFLFRFKWALFGIIRKVRFFIYGERVGPRLLWGKV